MFLNKINKKNKTQNKTFTNGGISLVEVVVATAILLLVLSGLYEAHVFYLTSALSNTNKVKATFLAEEGIEAVKMIRDQGWLNISAINATSTQYLSFNGSLWKATSTKSFIDGIFERKFTLENVNRDSNGDIVSFGGLPDPGTRLLTVIVSWPDRNSTSTKSISTYITHITN